MGDYIKNRLRGAASLFLLFGDGIKAFSGKKEDGLKSLLIPLALFPVGLAGSLLYPPRGMQKGYSAADIMKMSMAGAFIDLLFMVLVILGVGILFRQMERLWLFVEACNWTSLIGAALSLPVLGIAAAGWVPRDEMDRAIIVFNLYGYIVAACIANRSFRLNWQLAGAIACVMLVADQESASFAYRLMNVPYPWDY